MTEGEADPFAADAGLARHAVDVVPLTRPAHHEQASMLDVERPVRSQSGTPRLQHELACRAERQRGDDRIEPELGLVIGVETDAVGPVAVAIGEHVIERHPRVIDHACEQRGQSRLGWTRLERLSRVPIAERARPGDQPRLEHPPAEHHDLPLLPREFVAQGEQQAIRLERRDPGGEVVEPRAISELDPARHQAIIRASMSDAKRRLSIAITGATLIDGTRRPPLANATIVIDGDRIARAGPAHDTPAPEGAEIIDGRGRFVIPGLTDMHVHVLGPDHWHAPLFLAAGITTVLDLGGQLPDLTALRGAIDAGTMPGPRLLYTGPFLEEGEPYAGFAHMARRVDGAHIEDAVDELADAGVHAIKLYVTITPGTAARACARARERGLRVFMHQQETWGADAADAGVDCVEHMMVFGVLAPEVQRPPEPGRLTPFEYGGWMWRWLADVDPRGDAVARLFDRLIAADTALDPTLVLFAARPGAFGDDVGDTSMDDPERTPLLPNLPDRVREELINRWAERRRAAVGVSPRGVDRMRKGWEHLLALVGRFHRAGGTVLAGTDCPNVAIVSGFSLHRELELLVRAGLSPMDALLAATSRSAARLDREDEFGTIAPGLSADLVLLAADPLADIRNVRRIERVVARGRVYEPQRLLQPS